MTFLEASALTGENVEEVFLKTARSILAKIEAGPYTMVFTCVCIMGTLHHRRVGSREDGVGYTIRGQIVEEKYYRTSITEIK